MSKWRIILSITLLVIIPIIASCASVPTTPSKIQSTSAIPIQSEPRFPTETPTINFIPTQGEILRFVTTIQVTPDSNFQDGSLGYIHYVPTMDRFVVILGVHLSDPVSLSYSSETCRDKAIAYKVYTKNMQPTGEFGYISCATADVTSQMIENYIYLVSMTRNPDWIGWRLEKFDPVTWQRIATVDIPLEITEEIDDGPTISFINGLVTVSGEFFPGGSPDGPLGRGSHHHFFTSNLEPRGKMILSLPEYPTHCPMASFIQQANGDILMFASSSYAGDLIVLHLNKDWKFIEQIKLRDHAFFPTGSLSYHELFYIAYVDVKRPSSNRLHRNIGLAAYNADWQSLEDITITDTVDTADAYFDGESPWIEMHANQLLVSYTITRLEPSTGMAIDSQAYVNVYEIVHRP